MSTDGKDVVVIGGGVTGIATAYFLGKAGVKSVVVERDSVGSHASGFAYGGLSPLGGTGIPGPIAPVAREGMRLHRELAESLPEETGVNTEYRTRPSLALVFTDLALVHRRHRTRRRAWNGNSNRKDSTFTGSSLTRRERLSHVSLRKSPARFTPRALQTSSLTGLSWRSPRLRKTGGRRYATAGSRA